MNKCPGCRGVLRLVNIRDGAWKCSGCLRVWYKT